MPLDPEIKDRTYGLNPDKPPLHVFIRFNKKDAFLKIYQNSDIIDFISDIHLNLKRDVKTLATWEKHFISEGIPYGIADLDRRIVLYKEDLIGKTPEQLRDKLRIRKECAEQKNSKDWKEKTE